MKCFLNASPILPGIGEVIRRVWFKNYWTLDAGDSNSGNKQELNAPSRILQYRKSMFDSFVQADFKARIWLVMQRLSWDTHVMHDFP